jgi:hypothetical protein
LRLVNVSSRFFDPYTFPLGTVSCISSIRTLLNASTRTSNNCATPSLTALGLRLTLGFFVSCMCASCSTTHGVKWLMIFLFACPQVLLTTSVLCYVFTSGNLSTTSLTTVTFRLTHVRNADISSVSASLSDTPWPLRFWQMTLSRLSINPMSDWLLPAC